MTDILDRFKAAVADRYQIEQELGSGGMATVYRAEDLKHHRQVAIKVLKPELAAAIGPERFLREIEVAARLTHPHILPLHDSGEADGFLYYVMPYIEGESLRDRLTREKQLPVTDALQIAREVADALGSAHSHDVVHRDIKPENVLLEEGHAVVADFGVALAVTAAGTDRLTETGFAVGTPAYMSPEQASGSTDLDGRSDVYGLGCMLYEVLAGEPPFTGPTTESVVYQHLTAEPPHVTATRPAVPTEVDAVLEKALAKTPADRYSTAAAFADALADCALALARPELRQTASAPASKSIAVLPFANLSPDPENEYFSDGLSEDLLNTLTNIKDFRVAARASAFSFKGGEKDVRDVGRKLNVKTVLDGSVQRAGNRLRITARLINVDDGYHLWSEQYDRVMADAFEIQDEITWAIVDALKLELLAGEEAAVTKRYTDNVEAYHLYLRGRYYWNRSTTEAFWKAIEQFQAAIALDPSYALAYAGVADAYAGLGDAGHSAIAPKQAFSSARAAVERALEIDDALAEAHASLAHLKMHELEWKAAEMEFSRAIELNPNYATTYHLYAFNLAATERSREAIAAIERALELDPLSLRIITDLGVLFYFARQYDRAIAQYQKTLDMDPSFVRAYVTLGSAYVQTGMHDKAIPMLQKAIDLSGDRSKIAALGRAHAAAGNRDEALRIIGELSELARDRYITPYAIALIYACMDEKDQAFAWLKRACNEGVSELIYLKVDPFLDNLRSDRRFTALLESVGFDS